MFIQNDLLPNELPTKIPNELYFYIFRLANNRCNTCNHVCVFPYKKLSHFYYCSRVCYLHI